MKYKVVKDKEELHVIAEDGGIVCIRDIDDDGTGRQSTSDYYQSRMTQEMLDNDILWDDLGEGKMYYNDWLTPFDDPAHIQDALDWLCPGEKWIEDDSIWKDFEG